MIVPYKDFSGAATKLPTHRWGEVSVEAQYFTDAIDGDLVVYFGNPLASVRPLVRIQSTCVFAEVLGSTLCECAEQLELAIQQLAASKRGILIYLRIDGRGAGLASKVASTKLEVDGVDTVKARIEIGVNPESRTFDSVGHFLKAKGINNVELLTNNPLKITGLNVCGINVEAIPLIATPSSDIAADLMATKKNILGHTLD